MSLEKIDGLIRRLQESVEDHEVDWKRTEKEMALAVHALKDAADELRHAEGDIYYPLHNMGSTLESIGDVLHSLGQQDDKLFDMGTTLKNIGLSLQQEWSASIKRDRARRERLQAAQAKANEPKPEKSTS